MKKLLFFIPNLYGGGAERVIINIINALDYKYFEVYLVVIQNRGVYFQDIDKNVNVIVMDYKKVSYSIFGICRIIKKIEPDFIFSTTHRMNILVALSNKFFFKKYKVALRLPNSPKLELQNKKLSYIQTILYSYIYRSADIVVAQTPEMKKEAQKYFHINKSNIQVFINPINKKLIDTSIKCSEKLFEKDAINIVTAGRLSYQKGFDILIKSMEIVVSKNNNFRLYILGATASLDEERKLKKLTKSLNLEKYIHFMGFQRNPYKYFHNADLYVLSSRWEGLPNTVLENLYLHKPVVSTRCIPFMDQLISDGKNGYLVDVEDIKGLAGAILKFQNLSLEYIETFSSEQKVNNFFKKMAMK